MIQAKQPKKVKGARKKAREEAIERLQLKYPTWFEGKTNIEIRDLVNAFRLSGKDDNLFPNFCIEYEAELEKISETLNNCIDDFYIKKFINEMREPTKEERESIQNYIDDISEPTGVNFYDLLDGED